MSNSLSRRQASATVARNAARKGGAVGPPRPASAARQIYSAMIVFTLATSITDQSTSRPRPGFVGG